MIRTLPNVAKKWLGRSVLSCRVVGMPRLLQECNVSCVARSQSARNRREGINYELGLGRCTHKHAQLFPG